MLNYNDALGKLNKALLKKEAVFNLKLILDIQKEITSGLIEKYRCGKLRNEPVFVNDPRARQPVYLPKSRHKQGMSENKEKDRDEPLGFFQKYPLRQKVSRRGESFLKPLKTNPFLRPRIP